MAMEKIREKAAKLGNPAARQLFLIYGALPLAYVIAGRFGLVLAVSPGYATAVFLPAGIAVGAAFMLGAASGPGTFLGSFLLNIWAGYSVHTVGAVNLGTAAAIIASASALQAGVGGALLRRVIGYPTLLDTSHDLLFFLLLSPCICLISATISNGGLWLAGILQSSDIAVSWMTWWGGDTLGVLVVLPIMAPRQTRGRQFSIVVPDQFTAEQNIAHYRSRLQMGAPPETRAILLNLLLHEEKQLGRTREQLVKIDSYIEKLGRIIAQQKKHTERFKFMGSLMDIERSTLILSTLNDLMATYQLHRQWITAALADSDGAAC
jgi:hypothetical protein